MRPSPLRTTIAVLRQTTGLNQQAFANLIERSKSTVQALELGKLPLSESLAVTIAEKTGISAQWLLANDPKATPLQMWDPAREYSRTAFEEWRARTAEPLQLPTKFSSAVADVIAFQYGMEAGEKLAAILRSALNTSSARSTVLAHRIARFLDEQRKEFGTTDHLPKQFQERAGAYYLAAKESEMFAALLEGNPQENEILHSSSTNSEEMSTGGYEKKSERKSKHQQVKK